MLRAIMLDVEELGAASSLERLRSDAQAMHLCSILREKPSLLLGPLLPQLERLDGRSGCERRYAWRLGEELDGAGAGCEPDARSASPALQSAQPRTIDHALGGS